MSTVRIRYLGLKEYSPALASMKRYTELRSARSFDEFWVVEHPPVFTLGLNAAAEHVLDSGNIPVIKVDRGGQVTYHGPGQVVIYLLIDLRRKGLGIRALVTHIEQAIVGFLEDLGTTAQAKPRAPGVYVGGHKIASLGLRVRRGCSYHGLAFNLDMDLSPFERINPCGYRGLKVTQLNDLGINMDWQCAARLLSNRLWRELGYTDFLIEPNE